MPRTRLPIIIRRTRRRVSRMARYVFMRPAFRIGIVIAFLALVCAWGLWKSEQAASEPKQEYETYFSTVKQVVIMLISGYDGAQPSSDNGYVWSILCTVLGIGLIALLTADLASLLVTLALAGTGRHQIHASDHVVICGWHKTTRGMVEQLTDRETGAHHDIVIIDAETTDIPMNDPDIQFVRGDPSEVEVLRRARLDKAHTAIVPIDWDLDESSQDPRTTLAVMAVKSINEDVYTVAEILKPRNRRHLERTGVDEIVCVGELSQKLMSQAAMTHGLGRLIDELLTFTHQSEIYKLTLPAQLVGRSFRWLLRKLNKERQAILVSVQRGTEFHTNPQGEFLLQEGDELFILAPTQLKDFQSLSDHQE